MPSPARVTATVPQFLYGTAWKEERTEALTKAALEIGFTGIDTANQRKHYFEAAVGAAVKDAIGRAVIARQRLFLQSKYTYQPGQDQRLPYDPEAAIATQVAQSFASSLEHFGTDYLDSYVLHGPSQRRGLGKQDFEAWQAMEGLVEAGKVQRLGVSNVTLEQLELFWKGAAIKPSFVQNRCYAKTGWDREIRAFCRTHAMIYQGFSLLTANRQELEKPPIIRPAQRTGRSPAEIVFRFALSVGMLPLTGTTDPAHMRRDLASPAIDLLPEEVSAIERMSG